ncbi:WD domain-containing protein [Patellaria atrata CBS 101060]|uniref:WD domain-containing protein n=1 Tax=Patellaria atrata CBS 101060 TaxID=1346257 RepID=A0A9P4SAH3_9PEZI|nr:WD domain-containing protein [Patellaria atrata CBS 101060]
MSSQQYAVPDPPTDAISAVKFGPGPSRLLLVSSWDKNIYLYEVQDGGSSQLLRRVELEAPILDVCFGDNEHEAYTAGLDWAVSKVNLETSEKITLSSHDAGVKSVVYSPEHHLLISGSWDSTLHVHLTDNPERTWSTIRLPSKVYSMSITSTKLVVAMANRWGHIYELERIRKLAAQANNPAPNVLDIQTWQSRESSLKFMTRAVACMPNDAGYASSSIEGRVGVEWFDASEESQARKYAFKCHRQTENGADIVYPVNALTFHPIHHGTFASGGGDGVVALWDGIGKRRIRQYQRNPSSVAALAFSSDGKFLAVGVSPGFEDGQEDSQGTVAVYVRELGENEAKAKGAK